MRWGLGSLNHLTKIIHVQKVRQEYSCGSPESPFPSNTSPLYFCIQHMALTLVPGTFLCIPAVSHTSHFILSRPFMVLVRAQTSKMDMFGSKFLVVPDRTCHFTSSEWWRPLLFMLLWGSNEIMYKNKLFIKRTLLGLLSDYTWTSPGLSLLSFYAWKICQINYFSRYFLCWKHFKLSNPNHLLNSTLCSLPLSLHGPSLPCRWGIDLPPESTGTYS